VIVLVGIEGAEGNAQDPNSGYAGSFIHHLVKSWAGRGAAEYIPGPSSDPKGTLPTAVVAMQRAVLLHKTNQADGLILAGYSRGGAAAIVAAQLLDKAGITVDYLALFDAIERDRSIDASEIGANVLFAVHAKRASSANSRPLWGTCGTRARNNLLNCDFHVTHWGASGVPLHEGIPLGVNPTDFVTETDFVRGNERQTQVTWQQEITNSTALKNFMHQHMLLAYHRIELGKGRKVRQHIVVQGESLSLIAGHYWKDVLLWPLLHDANKGTIGLDPNQIKPGQNLMIPDLSSFAPGQLDNARQRGRNW
jgi:nucleoid-associated protein YgaU